MDTQEDYPKGNRELQNITRAERISTELEDKIMVETGNRTIKQKSTLQHILNGVKKHCGELKKEFDGLSETLRCVD